MNTPAVSTIRPEEAAHFASLARDWWSPTGPMASLHQANPLRLRFVRDAVDAHWPQATGALRPLSGKSALDVGCGAGLVCEPLARLGADVTGIDAAEENIAVASAHAEAMELDVRYLAGELEAHDLGAFDLVTSFEVIEHVADTRAFARTLASALKEDGLLILSTPNRTLASRMVLVEAAERIGYIPRGTHDWSDFITPDELSDLLQGEGLTCSRPTGISWRPGKGLCLSDDCALNYLVTARKV